MIDLTDPLEVFPSLREKHRTVVSDYFEQLLRTSGIDEELNARTVAELRALEDEFKVSTQTLRSLRSLRTIATIIAIPVAIWSAAVRGAYLVLLALAIAGVISAFGLTRPYIDRLKQTQSDVATRRDAKAAEAAAQMAPLNALHEWNVATTLFHQVLPDVQFDSYLTDRALTRLYSEYGFDRDFTASRDMVALQSGSFRDNPFILSRNCYHWIGSRTYFGSIVIYWTEDVRDSNGNWTTVQRSETLTASVTKPFPCYQTETRLMYVHEAAPALSFSRSASRLSGLSEGGRNDKRKQRAVNKVERKSRRSIARGTGTFTVMANTEFEALFMATDRDNEVEFRLLFTAMAQENMLALLNDRVVGYGDDFSFIKAGMLNFTESKHLSATDICPDPRIFASESVADARRFFNEFHTSYFKSLFFAFAPLWTIPLYSDRPSSARRTRGNAVQASSVWEHEVMANYIGEDTFRHPDSVTTNILKVAARHGSDGSSIATVFAHGYDGIPQVDVFTMRGGDGNFHTVPVEWTEYVPVVQQTNMLVGVVGTPQLDSQWQATMRANGLTGSYYQRGTLAAAVLG